MSPAVPSRVLICRLGAIGDVTNALVVATALRRARPDVEIGWTVHELSLPLVQNHPAVDRVHLWPRGSGLRGWRALVRELKGCGYELAIDLQRLQKSASLARLSGAPRVLGFDRARAKEASWIWSNERITPGPPHEHMVEQYMRFPQALGLADARPEHVLPTEPAAEAWADECVTELGGAPIVVNVGASKPPNRWAPERFALLAEEAVKRFSSPVCLAGGPEDRELAAALLARLPIQGVFDRIGRTTLPQLIALLRRARLFVGCDTGPMHLAAAVATPVVALFGPADPRRTGPWDGGAGRNRVVRSTAPGGAMEGVDVEAVLAEMQAALDS